MHAAPAPGSGVTIDISPLRSALLSSRRTSGDFAALFHFIALCPAIRCPMARDRLRLLLVDNHDSYTYNLCQRLLCVQPCVAEVEVVANNAVAWPDLLARIGRFDGIVLGPGPGVPSNPSDFGLCADILRWAATATTDSGHRPVPVLGVCLGHQGLAWALGGSVVRAPRVAHGVVEPIDHAGSGLFEGIPQATNVVRYHSWVVDEATLPPCLEATARTRAAGTASETGSAGRLVMALAHRTLPLFGVQFHPESVCAQHGDTMLANFVAIARDIASTAKGAAGAHNDRGHSDGDPVGRVFTRTVRPPPGPVDGLAHGALGKAAPRRRAVWRRLPDACFPNDAAAAFEALAGNAPRCFWLDSSRCDSPDDGRYSYMGTCADQGIQAIACDLAADKITHWRADGYDSLPIGPNGFMGHVAQLLDGMRCAPDPALPCGMCGGGLVGYLGYELRRECVASGHVPDARPGEPDAVFLVVDRFVALDHVARAAYAVALVDCGPSNKHGDRLDPDAAQSWFDRVGALLATVGQAPLSDAMQAPAVPPTAAHFRLDRDRRAYLGDIDACLGEIADGESYELCLTNKARAGPAVVTDPWTYYRRLRRASPAPYAAFLRLGPGLPVLASSSPEKFLSVDRHGRARSKPIKGTARRGATPDEDAALAAALASCPKTFAESLMIVDLVRNDLGMQCAPGSVIVPHDRLMAIESYAAVHQMVTTVDGLLAPGASALDAVRAAFPPGSMTGAPKPRTMEILNRIEHGQPRGAYSGALGFLSADGACCMSVVIRTAVIDADGSISVGCGGAIVANSSPDDEFDEIILKADRLVRTAGGAIVVDTLHADAKETDESTESEDHAGVVRTVGAVGSRVLVETLRLDPDGLYRIQALHVDRVLTAAHALLKDNADVDAVLATIKERVEGALVEVAARYQGRTMRVRVVVDLDTLETTWTAESMPTDSQAHWALQPDLVPTTHVARLAPVRMRSDDPRIGHKSLATRSLHDATHAGAWPADDPVTLATPPDLRLTLVANERGQITEGTRACVALLRESDNALVTPPLSCGLLPGTMRRHLLDAGVLVEDVITIENLREATAAGRPAYLFNSVRGVQAARIVLDF
nr:P-aminobenzoic acid synthase [Pandoravirus massiliensis]